MANKTFSDANADEAKKLEQTWSAEQEAEFDLPLPQKTTPQGMLSGWRGVALGLGLGIALTAGGMTLLSNRPSTAKKPETPQQVAPSLTVTVAPAQTTRVARTLNTTGSVAARELLPVLPQTTGLQIQQVLVEEGDVVKAGQVMAVLDNSVLQAQIAQAEAELQSSQAVVQQRQAALQQARATLTEAQSNASRYRTLANQGAISRQELETRLTTAVTATEAVRLAQANIASAEADVRSNQAKIRQLRTQLGQTLVKAPAVGVVAEKIVRIGDVANGNQKLFSIIRSGQLELQALVPATQLNQVRVGASAGITSDTDSRVRLTGTVREIAPLVNAESREATVRIDLPANSFLRPGMFARAAITVSTETGVTVPTKAVLPQPDGTATVFLLTGENTVQARTVEVGEVERGESVEVLKGLQPGDRVVVEGAGYLKDGDSVKVVTSQ